MSTSAIFDTSYYLTNNADVVVAISQGHFASAIQHYNNFGGKELRQPNAVFNPNYYAINNSDVLNAVSAGTFSSVFAHYQEFGEKENRVKNKGQKHRKKEEIKGRNRNKINKEGKRNQKPHK